MKIRNDLLVFWFRVSLFFGLTCFLGGTVIAIVDLSAWGLFLMAFGAGLLGIAGIFAGLADHRGYM